MGVCSSATPIGSYEGIRRGGAAAVEHGWLTLHPPGGYLTFTQAGAELFA
jgi:hypothetical protein